MGSEMCIRDRFLKFFAPVGIVVPSCTSWYDFKGSLQDARVEVLYNHVDVSSLDRDVLGEGTGSVFKGRPVCFLVIPPWEGSFRAGSKIHLQKDRPMVTTS